MRSRRAFTLVEMVCAITVLAVVGAVALPVMGGATDAYTNAAITRRTSERAAYALERVARLLRDAPEGATDGAIGVQMAAADSVLFTGNRGVYLQGSKLYLTLPDSSTPVLCDRVEAFTIEYRGEDGVTNTIATPAQTQRFNIMLRVNGFELRTSVLARVRIIT